MLWVGTLMGTFVSCTNEHTYKIAVSQCGSGQWRDKVNNEMLAAQHLYEQNVKVEVIEAHDDTERQIRQIDSLANTDIDLLVVAPNEAAPVSKAIAKVYEAGIPVIYFDRKADATAYTAFIGGNNFEAGEASANYVLSLVDQLPVNGHKPRVVEITGAMSSSPAQERHQGFLSVMKEHGELEYACMEANWTSDSAYQIAKEQIDAENPPIFFCHNDGMATGVYKAIVEKCVEGQVMVTGIDGLPNEGIEYVLLGHQVGSYVYPTHGELVVKLALDILTGQPYERENELQGMMVTPENAKLMALNSKELIRQNYDLITIQDKLEAYFGLYDTQHKVLIGSFIAIILLAVALIMMWRAYIQTRRTIRQRQALNEEETLFYTNTGSRTLVQVFETPKEELPVPKSQDTIFAETLNEAIRKNMSNPNLKMEELGEEIGLGRVQLYRKVKSITGLTPVELLRKIRLQQGYVLLTTTTRTVAEIAFEVGFNTPGYFSKCFKEQYGKLPGALRANEESQ
ncbi:MAG: substrate-binding domain-containing protein [Prevotella sp.]|nr:substrate-binding domain-containing protein [Prevotella sp.]